MAVLDAFESVMSCCCWTSLYLVLGWRIKKRELEGENKAQVGVSVLYSVYLSSEGCVRSQWSFPSYLFPSSYSFSPRKVVTATCFLCHLPERVVVADSVSVKSRVVAFPCSPESPPSALCPQPLCWLLLFFFFLVFVCKFLCSLLKCLSVCFWMYLSTQVCFSGWVVMVSLLSFLSSWIN